MRDLWGWGVKGADMGQAFSPAYVAVAPSGEKVGGLLFGVLEMHEPSTSPDVVPELPLWLKAAQQSPNDHPARKNDRRLATR